MYGEGISKTGELVDLGVKAGIVEKSGAWFSYNSQRLGQGRENAKQFLRDNPDMADEIELALRQNAGLIAEKFLEDGSRDDRGRCRSDAEAGACSRSRVLLRVRSRRPSAGGFALAAVADRRCAGACTAGLPALALVEFLDRCRARPLKGRCPISRRIAGGSSPEGSSMSGVNDIRSAFLDYFGKNGHEVVAVEPAGAAQRPDADVHQCRHGAVQERLHRPRDSGPTRAPRPSQKCVRAGGKHNDLDNVGYTARHHTFFEMLGNFSFGDYFKEQRDRARLEPDHQGVRPAAGQAAGHRLSRRRRGASASGRRSPACPTTGSSASPTTDNFWAMGDTGPCGPCSEIFYDHGDHIPGGPPGSAGRGRRPLHRDLEPRLHAVRAGRRRTSASPLPRPSIDTGMGLERIAAVLQGVHDNYDIDLFRR